MHYFQETYASLLLVSQFIYLFLIISICYWSQSCGKLTGYVGLGCLLDNLMGTTRNYLQVVLCDKLLKWVYSLAGSLSTF